MPKRDSRYRKRPGTGTSVTFSSTIFSAGSKGRVWSLTLANTTAAACQWNIRTGSLAGTIIWIINVPATIAGITHSVIFPAGLFFPNGLFFEEITGVGVLTHCSTVDEVTG